MRDDFVAFILSHGRADRVHTYDELRRSGYTGRIYVVIDDEDESAEHYHATFGAEVLVFSKANIAARFDEADNFDDRRAIFYARNACWDLARQVGARYFIQLDDDYTSFFYRFDTAGMWGSYRIRSTLNDLFEALVDFLDETQAATVAISQGGDHIGGAPPDIRLKRKAMNSFVCDVERPFDFVGRVNEDVNTYVSEGRRGKLFLTVMQAQLNQKPTQANAGGMTDLYLDAGTYVKSFYTVLYAPSAARIGELGDPGRKGGAEKGVAHYRIHHAIDWPRTAPCILREEHRRER